MKNATYLFFTFVSFYSLSGYAQSDTLTAPPKIPDGAPTIMLGITTVNSLDSDSTEAEAWSGGGLELVRSFSTLVYPDLRPCPKEIRATGIKWQKDYDLIPAKDVLKENELTLKFWLPDYNGLFEIKYLSKPDGTYARSWLNYYTLTGERLEIETIEEYYTTYKISQLWDDLAESMGCSVE
ncbi:hypothetical protein [Reichenbachiella sp. MSK19-1]|uniref:hypothetical protein n=1 Tax=Reichenbachiella sp. MSK19-1 TaxID=1897631 RepID=UPI000E6CC775|nr:hypothetical protein [Reichenbachiella sp. MSK19-1]RJE74957.1 hypothetical protein BGP76_17715 [Reichenbachiella sp. MSK19-1]